MNFEQLRDIIVDTLSCDAAAVTPESSLLSLIHISPPKCYSLFFSFSASA